MRDKLRDVIGYLGDHFENIPIINNNEIAY